MSYSSQTDYELAKARKFIASVDSLRGRFSVGIRTPKPSPNKPKFPYYVLVEKLPGGGTKTVHKAYNINELMAYFIANNSMVSALWNSTNPNQPKAAPAPKASAAQHKTLSGMENLFSPEMIARAEQENKARQHREAQLRPYNQMFENIKKDLVKSIVKKMTNDCLCIDIENITVIEQIEGMLQQDTKNTLEQLSRIKEFDYFDKTNDLVRDVVKELKKRGKTVYRVGQWRYPEIEYIQIEYLTTNKEKGLATVRDEVQSVCDMNASDENAWDGMTYEDWEKSELSKIFCFEC